MSVCKVTSDLWIDCFSVMQQGCFIFWGCWMSQEVEGRFLNVYIKNVSVILESLRGAHLNWLSTDRAPCSENKGHCTPELIRIPHKYRFRVDSWWKLWSCNDMRRLKFRWSSSSRLFIPVINQLDAQNFCFIVSLFHAYTWWEYMCSSSGGQNCITQPLVSSHL